MTQEDLRKTEIGNHFNTIRKLINDTVLAKRLKDLVRLWYRQEEQRKEAVRKPPVFANGDTKGATSHSNPVPIHPTSIQKHKNKMYTSFNNKIPSPQPPNTAFKISIPLSKILLHINNTQTSFNVSNNNSYKHTVHKIPQQTQPSSEIQQIPHTTAPIQTEHITEIVEETDLDLSNPLGATPPHKPEKFPYRTEDGVTMGDGRTYLWTDPVVIEETCLVIRPYASLCEWEDQLTLRLTH
ncbi:hypothetical protein LOD99_11637 [Oopsacas minuta]|uniref:Uncharacterized protein n=1 Tax=Oopsacas minuta TaxID=111878 RepID=A0AAV7JLG0_9METZ|nr:hypothetical protein LOD99_11637 [Oopsacas minuta]